MRDRLNITPLIRLDHVRKVYPDCGVQALKDVSLVLTPGEFVAITGPSGSGKTTLLHIFSGMDRPSHGQVFFEGQAPDSVAAWAGIRARRMGFVFQDYHLLPNLTALENVQIPMFGVIGGTRNRMLKAKDLLHKVGLGKRLHHRANKLSGGERQRVAVARSLANSPAILLADEPTGNLDSKTSVEILNLLCSLAKTEMLTLVIVTHDPLVAERAGRILQILDGHVVSDIVRGAPS